MLYRIVADAKRIGDVIALVGQRFSQFTAVKGASYDKGRKEYTVSVDLLTDEKNIDLDVRRLAYRIQQLTSQPVRVYVIDAQTLTPLAPEPPAPKKQQVAVPSAPTAQETSTAEGPTEESSTAEDGGDDNQNQESA